LTFIKKLTFAEFSFGFGLLAIGLLLTTMFILDRLFFLDPLRRTTIENEFHIALSISAAAHLFCFCVGLVSLTRYSAKRAWIWSGIVLNSLMLFVIGLYFSLIGPLSHTELFP
jgi:hypothetical protein